MRFVLANRQLTGVGGTEVHLGTVAEHLERLGHEAHLYAPEVGAFGEHLRRRGLKVHDSVHGLPETCDVVFSQDGIVVYEMAERYPEALGVFRICGDVHDFQLPPQLDGAVDLVVVLSDRYERVARATAIRAPILRMQVPIDVDRLAPNGAIGPRPQRAVLLGNYGERNALIRQVWGEQGVEVREVGGDEPSFDVAAAVASSDVVVAKSRAALDAMACGRAVYVYDLFGGDGWVTAEAYPALEADQFAGQATGRVIDAAALSADLDTYEPGMGTVNRDLVLQHHNARDHVVALLAAIGERAPQTRPPAPLQELARLTALQWSAEATARQFRGAYWGLTARVSQLERDAVQATARAEQATRERDQAIGRAAAADDQLRSMRATRAWRLARAWWRLRDRPR
jgi:hypothetical protein